MAFEDLDVVGTWPALAGKTIGQLIAQESWFEGELDDEANVVWIQIAETWHRLYFDSDAVFWTTKPDGPRTTSAASDEVPEFPLNDLGVKHELIGQEIKSCDGNWTDGTSAVTLRFENGKALTFRNRFDTTTVVVG